MKKVLENGTLVSNRYKVVGFLGQGGYGDVYEVKDL